MQHYKYIIKNFFLSDKNGETGEGVDSKKTEEQLRIEQLAKEVEAIVAPGSNKLFASLACRSIRVGKLSRLTQLNHLNPYGPKTVSNLGLTKQNCLLRHLHSYKTYICQEGFFCRHYGRL